MAVMIEFDPAAFLAGGKLEAFADSKEKIIWVIQTGSRSSHHIAHHVWFPDKNLHPANSRCIEIKGSNPSWFDTALEFNSLEPFEIRAQIANEIERGILRVRDTSGSVVTADVVRDGSVT